MKQKVASELTLIHRLGSIEILRQKRTVVIRQCGSILVRIHAARTVDWEASKNRLQRGTICRFRVTFSRGLGRTFFLSADSRQATLREIHPSLWTLRSALQWLLPPGYAHRQGDIGIYRREQLPTQVRAVSIEHWLNEYAPILHFRHRLVPLAACAFYKTRKRYFVRLQSKARIIHPEHEAVLIPPGLYELVGARGRPIPRTSLTRVGRKIIF